MAYLRIKTVKGARYFYIMRSVRRHGAPYPVPVILEYLGREPEPARVRRALAYWQVKRKPSKGRR